MATTVGEAVGELHGALSDYIEATYHIGHPQLVEQRHRLLGEVGVIHQTPFFESTPKYRKAERFRDIAGLDQKIVTLFESLATETEGHERLIHDPPYQHQSDAVQATLVDRKSIVVMTGTGSGKTESFLLPTIGKLAREAINDPAKFRDQAGVRALVLYPMNALVNDQLGRMRLLFGDSRVAGWFSSQTGRPLRFARYTSRTLYPGVRSSEKDQIRLKPVGDYYVAMLHNGDSADLVQQLRIRGKWPAKPDIERWYGKSGSRWRSTSGSYLRCVTLPSDSELLTRDEVQTLPPEVLVTNYSMLEYMLMRPLERPIFDATRKWLEENPSESFLLILDEAHLYRGAAGTEVALLLRRLRTRLGITPDRLQVICTSASFSDPDSAAKFAANLTGKKQSDFLVIGGELDQRQPAEPGTVDEAQGLASFPLEKFYGATNEAERQLCVHAFLASRGVGPTGIVEELLYRALVDFAPMNLLINRTMTAAWSLDELNHLIFPSEPVEVAARALSALMALGSNAKQSSNESGLLPCRVHALFRGLPGLWICIDPQCSSLREEQRTGPAGRLFGQPRETCDCGARVFELYTCRQCGTAYARAYTDNVATPSYLWAESGQSFRDDSGNVIELMPLDLLLEAPIGDVEVADLDLVTGRLNPPSLGDRVRVVFLRKDRWANPDPKEDGTHASESNENLGEFTPCAVCGETAAFGRSSVQDHQTKGDQPFQALVVKQIQIQPPSSRPATKLAPLRGRKVLVFSDSRQMAARLAPNIQEYSNQDVMRPLMVVGFTHFLKHGQIRKSVSLEDAYLAILIAASQLGVRLRPELRAGESFEAERIVDAAEKSGALDDPFTMQELMMEIRSASVPEAMMKSIIRVLTNPYYGLEALALASLQEREAHHEKILMLPSIGPLVTSDAQKLALTRMWLGMWSKRGVWLSRMPPTWLNNEVQLHSGKFSAIDRFLTDKSSKARFKAEWREKLLGIFAEPMGGADKYRLKGSELTLQLSGAWEYCHVCRAVRRAYPGHTACNKCGTPNVQVVDPDNDAVFVARKGFYRNSTREALNTPPIAPLALIAAEHTAQLGAAQENEVYAKTEEHELLFQDVDLGVDDKGQRRAAIDVLSCTTTMEVGIDIGSLSGVALRNMPPARANYQQRAGRAGRRGNALATVIALASADSHDEHFFAQPDQLVRGRVDDPTLNLDNYDIVRRHVTAFLLQRYLSDRMPNVQPEKQSQLFEVLGTVEHFLDPAQPLSRDGLKTWLEQNNDQLCDEVSGWLPSELSSATRLQILAGVVSETLNLVDGAILADSVDANGEAVL